MRKHYIFVCILVAILLLSSCSGNNISLEKGEPIFGTFVTTDLAGHPVNEQIFKGHKLTMVNIWATFCGPCINEMPALGQLQTEYGDTVQIIGIVADAADRNGNVLSAQKAEAESIVASTGANYLHLLPSKSLNSAYLNQVQAVPETVFLDENGNQLGESYLGARSKVKWKKIIDALLESLG